MRHPQRPAIRDTTYHNYENLTAGLHPDIFGEESVISKILPALNIEGLMRSLQVSRPSPLDVQADGPCRMAGALLLFAACVCVFQPPCERKPRCDYGKCYDPPGPPCPEPM